ncbi:MAG: POTRA domain-containing protein [Ferruginibacter sp.]
MKYFIFVFFPFLASFFSYNCYAQQAGVYPAFNDEITKKIAEDSSSKIYVSSISITGNKRTKDYIIQREMKFKAGDSIPAARLFDLVEQSRALIHNTSLFSEVELTPVLISASELEVKIRVLEKIYIYPTPQFKLVDRNINEWLKTYHADLNRVEYGAKFAHYNFSGRGDKLRIYLLNGYARAVSFSYSAPYSNGALNEGFSVTGSYLQNRRFNYKTDSTNKLVEFKKDGFVKNTLVLGVSYQRRRGFFKRNIYSVFYNFINVNDSVVTTAYNPHYINSTRSSVGYIDLQYEYQYSNTNNVNYPLKGKIIKATILKRGIGFSGGVNMLSLDGGLAWYFPHKKNWYSSVELRANIKLPFEQPFINQNELGYRELYLRGLEYYVIDGVAAAVSKYTVKKKLVSFYIPLPFGIKKIPRIPFTIFAKTYADMGFSYNKKEFDTQLGNRFLYTGGFGIDIISLYDTKLGVEYSFNQLGENGLFLHAKALF